MFYVAHLSGWDVILRKPELQNIRATIFAGTAPVTSQRPGMVRFYLRIWQGNQVTVQKSHLATAANTILARADELVVRAAELENQYTRVVDFAALFPTAIPRELPSLRKLDHKINIIPASS